MLTLSAFEVRVLGSLAEKAFLTPDNYPLSLNAVTLACNQLSNREPVMQLSDEAVQQALESLKEKKLARMWWPAGSRISKWDHILHETLGLNEAQLAAMTVLMLRGHQTPGEIRGRTARMHTFHEVERVEAVLRQLIERDTPLVMQLPRAPGTKEFRYAHLLSGAVDVEHQSIAQSWGSATAQISDGAPVDRIGALEAEVRSLRAEVERLAEELAQFRKAFD